MCAFRSEKIVRVLRSYSRLSFCLSSALEPQNIFPKVCIVGSGPASFYAAQQLIKALPTAEVDIYERFPVPFGLVRFGVAPDHPEVKNVINTFTKTASEHRVNFIGNVTLGKDISLQELQSAYHSVLLAYGADEDNELGIPGENLRNVLSAREFVGWYNGLPQNKDLNVDLDVEKVAIIGQGNVALDVARILLTPIDLLKKTDITDYALAALSKSKVKEVKLIGRRGPLQVAFTIKEFREMLKLPKCGTILNRNDFGGVEAIIPTLQRPRKRLTDLLFKTVSTPLAEDVDRYFKPLFFRTPKCVLPSKTDSTSVGGLHLAVNVMDGDKAIETDQTETEDCGLLLRSIGYRSVQADKDIPFNDKRGLVKNDNGVVAPGLYVSGWVGTGPVGVILSTMSDAFAVAETMVTHLTNNIVDASIKKPGLEMIWPLLKNRGVQTVSWRDWERIDVEERRRGGEQNKLREKIVDISEMLKIASQNKPLKETKEN